MDFLQKEDVHRLDEVREEALLCWDRFRAQHPSSVVRGHLDVREAQVLQQVRATPTTIRREGLQLAVAWQRAIRP